MSDLKVNRENLINYLKVIGGENYEKFDKMQIASFIQTAQVYDLNPFKKEIYAIPYRRQDGGYQLTIIVGYESYIKRAERSGMLEGFMIKRSGEGEQLEIICIIKKKGWATAFEYSLRLCDVPAKIKAPKGTQPSQWEQQPLFMLEKMVISRAFRLAFSDDIGGLQEYNRDENIMDVQDGLGNSIAQPTKSEPGEEPAARKRG